MVPSKEGTDRPVTVARAGRLPALVWVASSAVTDLSFQQPTVARGRTAPVHVSSA